MTSDPADRWEALSVPFTFPNPCWVRPGPDPRAPLVVLCHGMGEEPRIWARSWPRLLGLPVHILAPAGPYAFEIRGEGTVRIGHAWYLYDGGPDRFRATVDLSAAWLRGLIRGLERERSWHPQGRALVGHSQGAYFGYVAALGGQDLFTHLVAVAGRLKKSFVSEALGEPGSLRALILHGNRDRTVDPEASARSLAALLRAGYEAERILVPAGHRLHPEFDRHAASWLARAWSLNGV